MCPPFSLGLPRLLTVKSHCPALSPRPLKYVFLLLSYPYLLIHFSRICFCPHNLTGLESDPDSKLALKLAQMSWSLFLHLSGENRIYRVTVVTVTIKVPVTEAGTCQVLMSS